MKDSQLEKMSVAELRDLVTRANAIISNKAQQEKAQLRERWLREAKEAGVPVEIRFTDSRKGVRKGSGADVKFQHPDDPSLTWSGRGRKPKWLSEAGGNIERFRIA
ncbi:MAG TPA: H-NS histone family protein [Hyphomicrobiaceae bacterium]|nr:H-NS histone family protein [Hyphomicrobiaceae bacterium]